MEIYGVTNNGFAVYARGLGEFDVTVDYWICNEKTKYDIFDDFQVKDFEIKRVDLRSEDRLVVFENINLESFIDPEMVDEILETVQEMILNGKDKITLKDE